MGIFSARAELFLNNLFLLSGLASALGAIVIVKRKKTIMKVLKKAMGWFLLSFSFERK